MPHYIALLHKDPASDSFADVMKDPANRGSEAGDGSP